MKITKYTFLPHGDSRGQLISLEEMKSIPFKIKRVYYMYDTTIGVRRGFHAHKELRQILICTSGECKILLDDGKETQVVTLNSPNEGLYIDKLIWHEMFDFSDGAVLMSIASDYYNESDYIRNYDMFMQYIENKNL